MEVASARGQAPEVEVASARGQAPEVGQLWSGQRPQGDALSLGMEEGNLCPVALLNWRS